MSDQITIDPYQRLQIVQNDNGTITRLYRPPDAPTAPDPTVSSAPIVLSKDITLDQSKSTWLRVFIPRNALDNKLLLPLIVYFHGGGFILFSAASTLAHNYAFNLASEISAVVISVEYRLAPEHRLPAAFEDAMDALYSIRTAEDDWLRNHADLSNCFIMGGSAGGTIAYHAGLRATAEAQHLGPMKIRGLILHQPFFGGVQRCESELRLVNDAVLPPCVSDLMWELALPQGADRDHVYSNPTVNDGSKALEIIKSSEWKVMVAGCDGDPLYDRQIELMKMLERKGVKVVGHFGVGGYHGVEVVDSSKAKLLNLAIKSFMCH
ncbi:carboxylesterase 1-like [Humulus lupulus]|uniref:carboxylesterase 1-like n=1 Tax=Humulus lupulus TaxID=3486 RepID=UPI002B40EC43|nr:carboxylesterase 1-like [Humulus lupulus]